MSLDWLPAELADLQAAGLLRTRRRVTPLEHGWCELDGRRLRNFASNDYLGLAADQRVLEAAACALDEAGAGARASPLVAGRTDWHDRLEHRLARFFQSEAALLFPTGYAANLGAIAALVGRGDAVYCDRLNHASLIDGCRLSGAKLLVYPHADVAALAHQLRKPHTFRRRLIVTDSIFSMDGDAAPLRELSDLALQHSAMLLVDEAHAGGLYGPGGRGLLAELQVAGPHLIKIGTLSKAIGSQGGFVVGSQSLVDWLFNQARTQMFSTALTPAACAAAAAALDIIELEPERRQRLRAESERLLSRLGAAGLTPPWGRYPTCPSPPTSDPGSTPFPAGPAGVLPPGPIIPIILGDNDRTVAAAQSLADCGSLVACIRPPTVPRHTARLRISLTAAHSTEDIDTLAAALLEVLRHPPRT